MKRFLSVLSCVAIFVFPAAAQLTRDAPEFEVASVKRVDPQTELPPGFQRLAMLPAEVREKMNFEGGPGSSDPGRIRYHDVSLKMLLARAYDVRRYQIEGPYWLDSERYVVEAKLRPDTTAEQLRLMLQKLLAERFQIAMRCIEETSASESCEGDCASGSRIGSLPQFQHAARHHGAVRANACRPSGSPG